MFAKKSSTATAVNLDQAIDKLLFQMDNVNGDADEYAKMADQLVKLYKLKEVDSKKRVSPDTLAVVAGNLLGILVIVGHEKAHVMTSKAIGFVMKTAK